VILPLPIMDANLDGTGVTTVVPNAGNLPAAAALMPASQRMASKCRIRFPDVSIANDFWGSQTGRADSAHRRNR
jgi:hypothetical protein